MPGQKIFISYSHRDTWALDRLHAHLAPLRRDGSIEPWFDREILAGGVLDDEISEALESCDVFLALVSPDFLNSAYCYEQEMERARQRHAEGTARVIPVIVEPCDWTSTPLQQFKAVPRDGKPVSEWTNMNNALLDIVRELRRVASQGNTAAASASARASAAQQPQRQAAEAQRYRPKRDFDDIDRQEFAQAAFKTIRDYFEAAVDEINAVEGIKARFQDIDQQSFTCRVLNRHRRDASGALTVRAKGGRSAMGDISFSFAENAPDNTANGWFDIASDDFDLYLEANIFSAVGTNQAERLSPRAAAESLWHQFLQQADISYD